MRSIIASTETRRIFLIAGEESGDLHAAALIRHLRSSAPHAHLVGLGGPRMSEAGMECLHDLPSDLSVMGILPVLSRLPRIGWILDRLYDELEQNPPDLLVLVDFPGFNLQVARFARRRGIPVLYYIVPQLWAWGHWRIRRVRRLVDRMLVIFPFEEDFYRERGIDARFVGHPLLDHLGEVQSGREGLLDLPADRPVVGLLPGSRSQEIRGLLPVMLGVAQLLAREGSTPPHFLLPVAHTRHQTLVQQFVEERGGGLDLHVLQGQAHQVMRSASFCLVTSGTATLETAFFATPLVILYRVSRLARFVSRLLLRTPNFGIVNILAGRRIVPEFLLVGEECEQVAEASRPLLHASDERHETVLALQAVREAMSLPNASRRAAEEVLAFLNEVAPP